MSTYRLSSVFMPKSVAVIGASPRERSAGRVVLHNLISGRFPGQIAVVNPRHRQIEGFSTAARLHDLSWIPDLAIITAPPHAVAAVVAEAAERGVPAALVLSGGLGQGPGSIAEAIEAAARAKGMRLVGPCSVGLIAPHARLNASVSAHQPLPGDLALVSQSGAVAAGLVEWGVSRSIGFSGVVSLGESLDVDFGDMLDYFATDHRTRAILLYVESIRDARKFMSAARIAARSKPVVVVKSGRHVPAAGDLSTHVAALASADAVYDAAFRRAGLLRVRALDELFAAAETMGRLRTFTGRRLAILTNGGGVGGLAADSLLDLGGTLATLSAQTRGKLEALLPEAWSQENPVDILRDADEARYSAAIEALLQDENSDALLVVNVPTALSSSTEAALALTHAVERQPRNAKAKPVFAVWLGEEAAATEALAQVHIPNYRTEADAIRGFMHLVRHGEAQAALMETPPGLPEDFVVDAPAAQALVANVLAQGRRWLDPVETTQLLAAYGIPITPVVVARDAEEAGRAAGPLLAGGNAVAVKILSQDIAHKSDVDGVRLNLVSAQAVRDAAHAILQRARTALPHARIEGVTLHPMIVRPKARELIAGIANDPTFGPVVVFGRGGTAVEVIDDKTLALPPLDLRLAHEMIGRTRVSRILKAYRDVPPADEDAVALVLVKLAQMAADIPQLAELDINPLLADKEGVIAVDARVAVAPLPRLHRGHGHPRFAILPYPKEWESTITLADDSQALVRPVKPEDDTLFREFFTHVTDEDLRLRFFQSVRHFSHDFIARLTQIDYARSIALVAVAPDSGEMLGAVRLLADANYDRGEYGILVRSDLKGHGIGWKLMQIMIDYARAMGLNVIEGQVLRENSTMLAMCRHLGFSVAADPDDPTLTLVTMQVGAAKPD